MSYTLRGRIESRLAAAALPLAVALAWSAVARAWWPLELAALVLAVGLALDVGAYHRLLAYQPGWAALPLGALELGVVMLLVRALDIPAPVGPAVAFFLLAWLWAQVLGHAGLPLARLEYAEDGGELGRAGMPLGLAVALVLVTAGGVAWLTQPPTVRLQGVVQGPLVLDHAQTLVGGVVRGGIVITADDVTVRDVTVVGGDYGIEIREAHRVRLDRVHVSEAREDGIHARQSEVRVTDCVVDAPPETQGIDLSFAMDDGMSSVEGCVVHGGDVGITMHTMMGEIDGNIVVGAAWHGIELTEMSMGHVRSNEVSRAGNASIYCGDHSVCHVEHNRVVGGRGPAVLAFYHAGAALDGNTIVRTPAPRHSDDSTFHVD
jgi:Periplasmic copper-binding protein (NosD)